MRPRLLLLFTVLPLLGFSFTCGQPVVEDLPKVRLEYWRVFDDAEVFEPIMKAYSVRHPNVSIAYRKFRYDEYEDALLNALAEDRGPDLFSLPDTWMGKFSAKLLPSPATITIFDASREAGPRKRLLVTKKLSAGPTPAAIANEFVDSVLPTAIKDNAVLALPLSVDTLVLYANTDLLAFAGISSPAKSWEEVLEHVKKLRALGKDGAIDQAAIALGGSGNIPRASDILLTLMLQNGAELAELNGNVSFHKTPDGVGATVSPGAEALRFYTDFAKATKPSYTWNDELPNALDLFRAGRLAYLLGYSYTARDLKLAPKIHWTVNPLPQPQQLLNRNVRIALANTWFEGVSRKTKYPNEAWDFLRFLTAPEQANLYLTTTKKPAALRSLLAAQSRDPFLEVFALQALVSRSWYRGRDTQEMEAAFTRAIDAVNLGILDPGQAITRAAQQVQETLQSKL